MPAASGEELRFEAGDGLQLVGTWSPGNRAMGALLLHGLTGHRGLVTMGSRALERSGHPTFTWDARGHGASEGPVDRDGWTYDRLSGDALAALDAVGFATAVLVGVSMGAHTAARIAIDHPGRVAGLVLVTPAFDPEADLDHAGDRWRRLADTLESEGVEGFAEAVTAGVPDRTLRATVRKATLQRMAVHRDPLGLAVALREVPRSRPFASWADLRAITCPCTVIGSRDESDPSHPLAIARRWSEEIDGASFEVEEEGESPLAWRGGEIAGAALTLASG